MNNEFAKNILSLWGNAGKKWLDDIPDIVKTYEKKWSITVFPAFKLTYNYVAPAKKIAGIACVLKIGFLKDKEFFTELEALKIFNGEAAVKLLETDSENAVMLLEKIEPGTSLKTVAVEEQIPILASVIKNLHKHIPSSFLFPTLKDWSKGFERIRKQYGDTGPFPKTLFEKAERIFKEYTNSSQNVLLLHGDLHGKNILLSDRGWLAIDPKGIIGEKEYEPAAFLRNLIQDLPKNVNQKEVIKRSILQLSQELGFDKQKILHYAFAQILLSAIWSFEDHKEYDGKYIQNAELLLEINL